MLVGILATQFATGAWQVAQYFGATGAPPGAAQLALGRESDRLWFSVREPFTSRPWAATIVFGQITSDKSW